MRKGKEMNSCLFGEELVAYIYDELPASGRETFERHLLGCSGCTAELADISLSRLGVYEWHRDEFLPLETPQFVIPYVPKAIPAASASWIETFRGFLASPMRLATAGGAFALVVFAVVFGVSNFSGPSNQITRAEENAAPAPQVVSGTALPSSIGAVAVKKEVEVESSVSKREFKSPVSEQRIRPVQAKATKPVKRATVPATSAQSVPRLGNFVETEDTSLRLADLVANIDTKD